LSRVTVRHLVKALGVVRVNEMGQFVYQDRIEHPIGYDLEAMGDPNLL
jgi:hypothetical protein